MSRKKSRVEINLSRLLSRCRELANNSPDLGSEWRLPKFICAAEQMFSQLPLPPDPRAPSRDEKLDYQNQLEFLINISQKVEIEDHEMPPGERPSHSINPGGDVPLAMPHGPALTRDTTAKQIYQKTTEKAHTQIREDLFQVPNGSKKQTSSTSSWQDDRQQQQQLDSLVAAHREQQEKIAEEMLGLTKRLKEMSMAARTIVQEDTSRLDNVNKRAEENMSKLQTESGRISELSSRWNCRCWIWLAMFMVILTFIGMVLIMRLFKKRIPVLLEEVSPPPERVEL